MSRPRGPGYCHKPLWYAHGGDAGCCDEPAFGPTPKDFDSHLCREDRRMPLLWACLKHGGPPRPEGFLPTCPGIEIEPGIYSGCSGGRDCPTCDGDWPRRITLLSEMFKAWAEVKRLDDAECSPGRIAKDNAMHRWAATTQQASQVFGA